MSSESPQTPPSVIKKIEARHKEETIPVHKTGSPLPETRIPVDDAELTKTSQIAIAEDHGTPAELDILRLTGFEPVPKKLTPTQKKRLITHLASTLIN